MLIASLVLHVGVALGLTWAHFHATITPAVASSGGESESLILLRSVETPDFHQPLSSQRNASSPVASLAPASIPALPPSLPEKKISTTPPSNSLALEANPNVHIRALPPEAVLSPATAPHVNGKDGVVFILDISGSMYEPYAGSTRLAYARQILSDRIQTLKDGTPFSITLYAERTRNSGPLVSATNATREAAVRFIMRDVDCGGGTNLPLGLASAENLQAGSLVLVSDGDLNMGLTELMTKTRAALGKQDHCPALTIIGICPRPQTDAPHLLKSLADLQGGVYRVEQADDGQLLTSNRAGDGVTP